MHALLSHTLANALATAGTVSPAYPAGYTKGDFVFGSKHKIVALQYTWEAPRDFVIALGDSTFTITWKAAATLPAGTALRIQLDKPGVQPAAEEGPKKRLLAGAVSLMTLALVSLGTPAAADDNGICESQSLLAATAAGATLDGVLADPYAGAYAKLDVPRNVVAAWTTNAVLTVTGEDKYGNVMVEKSAGGSASFTGKKAFYKITSVKTDTNITGLTVGTGTVLGLPVFVPDIAMVVGELQSGQKISNGARGKFRLYFNAEQVSVLAGTTAAIELISPVAGVITKLATTVRVAVGTGGAVTAKVGTTDVDGLSITIADSATKGTAQTDTPTAGHASTVVAKGSRIQIVFADAFATTGAIDGYIEIQATDLDGGALVVGSAAQPTGTSNDVRGTYAPDSAPDGSISYGLMLALPDPGYLGGAQYAG